MKFPKTKRRTVGGTAVATPKPVTDVRPRYQGEQVQMAATRVFAELTAHYRKMPPHEQAIVDELISTITRVGGKQEPKLAAMSELREMIFEDEWRKEPPQKPVARVIPKELDTYDWREAFEYAKNPDPCPPPNIGIRCSGFQREDVKRILYLQEGQNEGDPWDGVFLLHDGRYAWLSAWCDYTGWDCQAGGESAVATSLYDLLMFGIDESKRDYIRRNVKV